MKILLFIIETFHKALFIINILAGATLTYKTITTQIEWYISIPLITFLFRLASWNKCPLTKLENKIAEKIYGKINCE